MLIKNLSYILEDIKETETVKKLFEEYDVSVEEINHIPVCFKELEVSARTDHGIIYLNKNMLKNPAAIAHYLVHEITHYLQQTTGDGPTEGSTDDNYLDNEYEKEGFNVQTEYLSEISGDKAAEKYINHVLDHHEVSNKERQKRKKELLNLADNSKD